MTRSLLIRTMACLAQLALLALGAGCAGSTAGHETVAADPLAKIKAEHLFRDGETLAARGDLIRAEQYLAAAIRNGYPAELALPTLLRVCIASSRLGAALQHATPELRLHPDNHQLRFVVASVLVGLGRHDEAQRELERVLAGKPDHAAAHYLLGLLMRDHYRDEGRAALHFEEHQRLARHSLHGAEVAAWLSEREHASRTTEENTEGVALPERLVLDGSAFQLSEEPREATP
jgi:tetratricopeptide (TPR) repeat protein